MRIHSRPRHQTQLLPAVPIPRDSPCATARREAGLGATTSPRVPAGPPDGLSRPRQAQVQPQCGRAVGFSSGSENPHGVKAVTKGQRCAIALWFTLDPRHSERVSELPLAGGFWGHSARAHPVGLPHRSACRQTTW